MMDLVDFRNHYIMSKLGAMLFRNRMHDKFVRSTNINLFHFNLGMMIRNNWHLWEQDENKKNELVKFFNYYRIYHPDNMSAIILQCYHNIINNKEMNFKELVDYYSLYDEGDKSSAINLYQESEELEELEPVDEEYKYD
jgi:hypothetical protein